MSPGTLEAHGLINTTEYAKVVALTRSASPDAHKKIAGNVYFVKEKKKNREFVSDANFFIPSSCK